MIPTKQTNEPQERTILPPVNIHINIPVARTYTYAFCVINANYAFSADVIDKLLVVEGTDQEQEDTYVNVIVVNEENKDSEKTQALVNALHSDAVRQYIEDTFKGVVVAKF